MRKVTTVSEFKNFNSAIGAGFDYIPAYLGIFVVENRYNTCFPHLKYNIYSGEPCHSLLCKCRQMYLNSHNLSIIYRFFRYLVLIICHVKAQ